MGGHARTYIALTLLASAVATGACSFDTSVAFEGAGDGSTGTLSPDAATAVDIDAGNTPTADASPGAPDAAPSVPDGTLQSFPRSQTLTLDGEIEAAWQAATFIDFAITDSPQLEDISGYVPDASLRLASRYDANSIYFFIEVTDDLLVDDSSNTFNDDSIELSIDGVNDRSGPFGDDDHWIVVGAEGVYASLGPAEIDITGAILPTATGYNIEIALERTDLGAGANTMLGFNIAINDDDGQGGPGVDAYGVWHLPATPVCATCCMGQSTNYAWCDTTRLGQLQLVP
jgi:hypothetical protein